MKKDFVCREDFGHKICGVSVSVIITKRKLG